jgi:hypothetical protein
MGAFAAVLPALASVAGPVLSWFNQRNVAKGQDRKLAQGIKIRGRRQEEANARVAQTVNKIGASNPDDERKQMLAGYQQQLLANKGQSRGGLTQIAGASDDYSADLVKAALGIDAQGAKTSDAISRIDAPIAQRRGEAVDAAELGSSLDVIGRKSQSEDYINKLQYDRIRANPWLDALAKVAGGIASAKGGGGIDLGSIFGGGGNIFAPSTNVSGTTNTAPGAIIGF